MKNQILFFAFILLSFYAWGQGSNYAWTPFLQSVDISEYEGKKFKLEADVKMEEGNDKSQAMLWARIDKRDTTRGFFDNMQDRPITSSEWNTYVIEGEVDKNATNLVFGGMCYYSGKFYFDNFILSVETKDGWEILPIENPSFEETSMENGMLTGWGGRIAEDDNFVPSAVSTITTEGESALLVDGKGVVNVPELFKKFVGKWKVTNHPSDENPRFIIEKYDYEFSLLAGNNGLKGEQDSKLKVGDDIIEGKGTTIISYHQDLKKIYLNNILSNGAYLFEGQMDSEGNIVLDRVFNEDYTKAGVKYHSTLEWISEDEILWTDEQSYGSEEIKSVQIMKRVDD